VKNLKKDRISYLFICIFLLSVLLICRLFYLQVIERPYYLNRAEAQKAGSFFTEIRGDIFDRNGIPLTGSYTETYAVISPKWLTISEKQLLIENNLLSLDQKEPYSIKVNSNNEEILKSHEGKTPGIFFYDKKKNYGPGALATHVVGYRGEAGIEKTFDELLRSTAVENSIVKDGLGQPIAGISSIRGKTVESGIRLTIDRDIQAIVERIMDDKIPQGAVVVIDADSGEILTMASRPNFMPYRLEEYLERKDSPLINRAIEAYTPGSIFKVIMLSAALEEGITDLDEIFNCPGFINVGKNTIKCLSYDKGGHGEITLEQAMAYSCNTVFIELGLRLGKDKILDYARKFGLNEAVAIGLPEEKKGFIPENKDVFYPDIGNLSIGQGVIRVTPLQTAQMILTIVNDGELKRPILVKEVINNDGNSIMQVTSGVLRQVITKDTARKVRQALEAVTLYGSGTNATPKSFKQKSAGKTGTAQVSEGNSHAWFVGYYPAQNPKYIISVFCEKGGSGSARAVPVFREIIEQIAS